MADAGIARRIAAAMRLRTVPLSLVGVAVGGASVDDPDPLRIGLCALVAVSFHVAGILVSDLFDHRAGTDKLARLDRSAIPTGGLQLEMRALTVGVVRAAAIAAMAAGVAAAAALRTPAVWPYVLAGSLLVIQYAGPPLRLAYVGAGFGELAIALAYGPLPAAATAIALGGSADGAVWWAGSVVGALVAMGFACHHFLHWRADKAATKRTPVVAFGEEGALAFVGLVDMAAYVALLAGIVAGRFHVVAAAGVLLGPPIGIAWRRALADPLPQRSLTLIGTHLAAAIWATLALAAGLALR